MPDALTWRDLNPADMVDKQLPWEGIEGPMNELGERCVWPWDPQQLAGAPLGQYHCPYCGGMQVAGVEHLDMTGVCLWCYGYAEPDGPQCELCHGTGEVAGDFNWPLLEAVMAFVGIFRAR